LLAKVDLEHAYQNIPIHRDDRLLLAMRWRGKLYLDTVLPFGLRSAPKILQSYCHTVKRSLSDCMVVLLSNNLVGCFDPLVGTTMMWEFYPSAAYSIYLHSMFCPPP